MTCSQPAGSTDGPPAVECERCAMDLAQFCKGGAIPQTLDLIPQTQNHHEPSPCTISTKTKN